MIHCPNCNHLISKNNKFCPYCGYRQASNRSTIQHISRRSNHHKNWLILILIILVLVGGGMAYHHHKINTGQVNMTKVVPGHKWNLKTGSKTILSGLTFHNGYAKKDDAEFDVKNGNQITETQSTISGDTYNTGETQRVYFHVRHVSHNIYYLTCDKIEYIIPGKDTTYTLTENPHTGNISAGGSNKAKQMAKAIENDRSKSQQLHLKNYMKHIGRKLSAFKLVQEN